MTGANGSTSTLTGVTNTSGVLSVSFKLNTRKTGTGTYTVLATATKTGYLPGSATTTFQVS
jgi:hypothetical protein